MKRILYCLCFIPSLTLSMEQRVDRILEGKNVKIHNDDSKQLAAVYWAIGTDDASATTLAVGGSVTIEAYTDRPFLTIEIMRKGSKKTILLSYPWHRIAYNQRVNITELFGITAHKSRSTEITPGT